MIDSLLCSRKNALGFMRTTKTPVQVDIQDGIFTPKTVIRIRNRDHFGLLFYIVLTICLVNGEVLAVNFGNQRNLRIS